MDPMFTIPYSEYLAASTLQHDFTKKEGYSVFVPASRQEEGVDLLLVRSRDDSRQRTTLALQVKGSRPYFRYKNYKCMLWFNNFEVSPRTDLIILVGIHGPDARRSEPDDDDIDTPMAPPIRGAWRPILFAIPADDMRRTFEQAKPTKSGKRPHSFYVAFDEPTDPYLTRGAPTDERVPWKKYLLDEKRVDEIKSEFH